VILLKIFSTPKRETLVGILMEIYKLPMIFRKVAGGVGIRQHAEFAAGTTELDSGWNRPGGGKL